MPQPKRAKARRWAVLRLRRTALTVAALAASLVIPDLKEPARWLFLYTSGIGSRVKPRRLPRDLERLLLLITLWQNRHDLDDDVTRAGGDGVTCHFTPPRWLATTPLLYNLCCSTACSRLHLTVGGLYSVVTREADGLRLTYRDHYNWDHTGVRFYWISRSPLVATVARLGLKLGIFTLRSSVDMADSPPLLPFCVHIMGGGRTRLDGEDRLIAGLGREFMTQGDALFSHQELASWIDWTVDGPKDAREAACHTFMFYCTDLRRVLHWALAHQRTDN